MLIGDPNKWKRAKQYCLRGSNLGDVAWSRRCRVAPLDEIGVQRGIGSCLDTRTTVKLLCDDTVQQDAEALIEMDKVVPRAGLILFWVAFWDKIGEESDRSLALLAPNC